MTGPIRHRGISSNPTGRFQVATRRLGLGERDVPLDATQFKPPPRKGDQLRLLL